MNPNIALPPLVSLLRRWSILEPALCSESLHLWSLTIGSECTAIYHDPQSVPDRGVILMALTSAIKAKGWCLDCQRMFDPYQVSIFNLNADAFPWGNGESEDLVLATLIAYLDAVEVLLSQQEVAA